MSLIVRFESNDIKNFIRPIMLETLKEVIENEGQELLKSMILDISKINNLPGEIQGDKKAGELIGLTASGMRARRSNGFYIEGKDFIKKSDRIILYDTNALLRVERNLKNENRS